MLQVHYLLLESWILMFNKLTLEVGFLACLFLMLICKMYLTCRECYSDILFLARAFGLGEDTTQKWNKPPPCYTRTQLAMRLFPS